MQTGYVIDRIKNLSTKGMSNSHFQDEDWTDMINQILDYIFIYMNTKGVWYYSNTTDVLSVPAAGNTWKTSRRTCSIFQLWSLDSRGNKDEKFQGRGVSVDVVDGFRDGSQDRDLSADNVFVKTGEDKITLNKAVDNGIIVTYARLPKKADIEHRDEELDLPEELKMALYSGVMWLVDGDGFLEQGVSLGNAKFQKMDNYLSIYAKSIGMANPMSGLIS